MGRPNARKVIRGSLSSQGIRHIIGELQSYRHSLERYSALFAKRLAEEGFDVAQIYLAEASPTNEDDGTADYDKPVGTLDIKTDTNGWVSSVSLKLTGQQVLFVEFGSGITFNPEQTPNPWSATFGMGVGTFPRQKHAFDDSGWSYYGNDDQWHHTHGIKATMPMFHASQALRQRDLVIRIAKEVFGSVI